MSYLASGKLFLGGFPVFSKDEDAYDQNTETDT
jgi:hypothetical protein